nr:MAG TPA: Minor structural protein putative tail fiber [Caudoviricetes sp.]
MIEIKDISGNTRFSTPINKGAKGRFTLMKEDYITLPFSVGTPIEFKPGDYVDMRGVLDDALGGKLSKVYKYLSLQKPNVAPGKYDYELKLDAYYYEWNTKIFKYTPENHGQEAGWNLTATLDTQLGVFLRNLKANGYTYNGVDYDFEIDSTVENKAMLMSYDNIHLLDALYSMAAKDKWNCDCWITDNIIHFGRCEFGDAVKIELGVEASSMARNDSKGTYATRIYVFGGTRNIPANYRPVDEQTVVNGVVQKRLMLPSGTPYIDAYTGMTNAEAVEDVVVFDDIYPRRIGTLSDVKTVDRNIETDGEVTGTFKAYQYKDTGLVFKEEYIIEGEELKVTFQSGRLNGMTFGVTFNPDGAEPVEQLWEIVANEDYGRLLPDDVIRPENGDKYILSGFNIQLVSDQYIPEAEAELLAKGKEYIKRTSIDDGTYPTTLDSEWVYQDQINRTYDVGQKIRLVNPAFFDAQGRISRVIGWEMSLDIPYDSPVYTIGESTQYSRLGELEDKVDSLTYKGQTYTGSGGSGVYVIRTNDSTPASDSNVFSALRSLATFLRKDKPDQTKYLIKLLGGLISDNIESQDFAAGPFGTGFLVKRDPKTGKSYIEADEIYIRLKAYFDTLEIKHLSHVGGRIVLSPASMECIRVEEVSVELDALYDFNGDPLYDTENSRLYSLGGSARATTNVYRCYFRQTDGEREIVNEFAIDDMAQCREFNVKTGISHNVRNQYYWRRVVGLGGDYIDLSMDDCDPGSMVPKAGDTIVTIGNKTDTNRQHVVYLSSYDDDAPCFKLYSGINSYSMLNKEVTVISPNADKNVFTGKVVIKPGSAGFENLTDKPDMEGINKSIKEAQEAVSAAQEAIGGVQISVDDFKLYVDGAFSDGIISEAETKSISQYVNIVNNERESADATYNELRVNPYLDGAELVSLDTAKVSLSSSIDSLINAVNKAIADKKATEEEIADVNDKYTAFNTACGDFYSAVEIANKKIQDNLKAYSDNAQKAADEANKNATSAMDSANTAKRDILGLKDFTDEAFEDGIISRSEAVAIGKYTNTVNATKKEVESTYNTLYTNPFLSGTPKTDLLNAKETFMGAVDNLLASIQTAISDGKTTITEKEIVDSKFSAFNSAYASLATAIENANKAIQQKIKEEAVNEASDGLISDIETITEADKNEMAKQLGYADYTSMKEQAAKGKTIINGASINTQLIDTDLLITSLVIAKAIKTSNLNVNDKFIVKTDGSVDMNGIFHSLGTKTELVISNGYLRIAYNGEEIMRFAVNQNTGMPELNMHKRDKSVFISPEKLVFGFGSGNNFLTLNPSDIGGGDVRKKSDGTLYVTTGETSLITVGIYVSPQEGGTTIPTPGSMLFKYEGEQEYVEAIPNDGYEFSRWSDGGAQRHLVTWDVSGKGITAYFTKIQVTQYTVTLIANPQQGGTVSGGGAADKGTVRAVSATPASGYRFVNWSDGGNQTHNVTWDANKTLTANFEKAIITGDEILLGTSLTSGTYTSVLKKGTGTLTASTSGGNMTVMSSSGNQGWVLFNKGYLGSKLSQGHIYRLSVTAKVASGTVTFLAGIGSIDSGGEFNDLSSGEMIYGEQITTSVKTFVVDITAYKRDSTVSDAVAMSFFPDSTATITITGISLKEV